MRHTLQKSGRAGNNEEKRQLTLLCMPVRRKEEEATALRGPELTKRKGRKTGRNKEETVVFDSQVNLL